MVLSLLISIVVFGAVFCATLAGPEACRSANIWLHHRSGAWYREDLRALFFTQWTPYRVAVIVVLVASAALLLSWWLSGSLVIAAVTATIMCVAPRRLFRLLRTRRLAQCEAQLVEALELLANAVKSGLTLPLALESVARQIAPPLAQEFALLVQEHHIGSPLDQVLRTLRERVPSKNLGLAITALLVSRERGGNLPETLDRIAASIREIHRLEERLLATTAEGRKSARTMAIMPFVLGAMLYAMDPSSFRLLFVDPIGNVLLFVAVVLVVLSFRWIKRIVSIPI